MFRRYNKLFTIATNYNYQTQIPTNILTNTGNFFTDSKFGNKKKVYNERKLVG